MMRSLFSGVSGLKNHQTRMDVIGNNIANVNTVGFKASRVTFSDVLSQTIQGASSSDGQRAGTNPMQVGLGVGLASIDTIFTDGSFQSTGKNSDLAIKGNGFFVLSADGGTTKTYTRAGSFDFDAQGNYYVPGTGYKVMGWNVDTTTWKLDDTGTTKPVQVPVGLTIPGAVTKNMEFTKNLSADATIGATSDVPVSVDVYDTLGNSYKLSGQFEKTGANTWTFTPSANIMNSAGTTTLATVGTTPVTLTFNATTGKLTAPASGAASITVTPAASAGTAPFTIKADFSQLVQFGGDSSVQITDQDGYKAGTLEDVTLDATGVIVGSFSNGKTKNLAKVCMAIFDNPSGLTKVGDNMYTPSNNSGLPQEGKAGSGGRGVFSPGTLEMSNVDLAQQFSDMIVTQRGFQANSKIISVSDEMLQDLANLKR